MELGSIAGGGQSSVDTLVSQFMAQERQPVYDLESQKKTLQMRLNIFADLKTKLSTLRDVGKDFTRVGALNELNSKSAVLSDSTYFSIDATGSAALGNHSIFVNRLATSDTGVSRQLVRDDAYAYATGLQEFTIALGDGEAQTVSVTIEDGDTYETVLDKVSDAINALDMDVSASVIFDTNSTARLSIKSLGTGVENQLDMKEINGSNILRKLKFLNASGERRQMDGTAGGFILQDATLLDAQFNLNGIDITKSSNKITDVLEGITINLTKANEAGDSPTSFQIETDTESIKTEITDFIEKYNAAITYLNAKTAVNVETFERGALAGDYIFGTLKFSIRSALTTPVSGIDNESINFLSQMGIEIGRDSKISIKDQAKFDEALLNNTEDVVQMFTSEEGIGKRVSDLLDNFVNAGGQVDRSKKGVTRQISSVDTRIKNYDERLAIRERVLRQQFTSLQRSLSLLNSQQSQITQFQSQWGGY